MKILKTELENAKRILDSISYSNKTDAYFFFDIDMTEEEQASNDFIILTENTNKKNLGYAGLTRLGFLKEKNAVDSGVSIRTEVSYAYVNLDYAPKINLKDLFDLKILEGRLTEEDIAFICSKDCYIIKDNAIVAKF